VKELDVFKQLEKQHGNLNFGRLEWTRQCCT